MKKFLTLLLALMMMTLPALAETKIEAQVLGSQVMEGSDASIVRVDFSGDKEIPSLYVLTQSPWLLKDDPTAIELQDVNFDGYEDLVLVTMAGASNTVYTFYLWDEKAGAFETESKFEVWNYQLFPAQGLVESYGTSGYAGLLHQIDIYGWEGSEMKLLRSVTWDTLTESDVDTDGEHMKWVERHDEGVIVETYRDYENDTEVVESFPMADYEDDTFLSQRFLFEDEFLGLDALTENNDDGTNG